MKEIRLVMFLSFAAILTVLFPMLADAATCTYYVSSSTGHDFIVRIIFSSALFVWILLLWFTILLVAGFITKKLYLRVFFVNIVILILLLGVLEIYFWKVETPKLSPQKTTVPRTTTRPPLWEEREGNYVRKDNILGYAPVKNSQGTVTKYFFDDFVYKATYTIDSNGLRVSPTTHRLDSPAILFFGDSNTFGEGVNDEETMPYFTGKLTDGEFAVYNFGFHGYGPQHMLAQIEHGLIASVITHKPKYAIYLAIPDHVIRIKGLYEWLKDSPLYILDDNGEIVSITRDKVNENIKLNITLSSRINEWLKKISYLYRTINKRILRLKQYWIENADIKTYVGVVDKSRNLLNSKYPGIEFHVIFLNDEENTVYSEAIIEALREKQIAIHKTRNITKDFIQDNKKPLLIPHDWHPTPLYNKIIADYIVDEIIGREGIVK